MIVLRSLIVVGSSVVGYGLATSYSPGYAFMLFVAALIAVVEIKE